MAVKINPQVDQYILTFPEPTQRQLKALRETIHQAAPEAVEVISYKIPAYKYYGMLTYFAARKNHIGFYPFPSAMEVFADKLAKYATSKGTVKFPLDKPLPLKLIYQIITFRVEENFKNEQLRRQKRRKK